MKGAMDLGSQFPREGGREWLTTEHGGEISAKISGVGAACPVSMQADKGIVQSELQNLIMPFGGSGACRY